MLSSIMHNITREADRYGTDHWMYRITGKRVDICARFKNEKNPVQYRQAVIHIGQVLQAIDQRVKLNGYKTTIQSLPNLREEHLIACVCLIKNDTHSAPEETKECIKIFPPEQSVETFLNTLISHYGLFLKRVLPSCHDHPELEKMISETSIETNNKQCMILYSKTNNPFIWLKTGYCKERITQLTIEYPSFPEIEFFCLPVMKIRAHLNWQFDECPYPQFLLLI